MDVKLRNILLDAISLVPGVNFLVGGAEVITGKIRENKHQKEYDNIQKQIQDTFEGLTDISKRILDKKIIKEIDLDDLSSTKNTIKAMRRIARTLGYSKETKKLTSVLDSLKDPGSKKLKTPGAISQEKLEELNKSLKKAAKKLSPLITVKKFDPYELVAKTEREKALHTAIKKIKNLEKITRKQGEREFLENADLDALDKKALALSKQKSDDGELQAAGYVTLVPVLGPGLVLIGHIKKYRAQRSEANLNRKFEILNKRLNAISEETSIIPKSNQNLETTNKKLDHLIRLAENQEKKDLKKRLEKIKDALSPGFEIDFSEVEKIAKELVPAKQLKEVPDFEIDKFKIDSEETLAPILKHLGHLKDQVKDENDREFVENVSQFLKAWSTPSKEQKMETTVSKLEKEISKKSFWSKERKILRKQAGQLKKRVNLLKRKRAPKVDLDQRAWIALEALKEKL